MMSSGLCMIIEWRKMGGCKCTCGLNKKPRKKKQKKFEKKTKNKRIHKKIKKVKPVNHRRITPPPNLSIMKIFKMKVKITTHHRTLTILLHQTQPKPAKQTPKNQLLHKSDVHKLKRKGFRWWYKGRR